MPTPEAPKVEEAKEAPPAVPSAPPVPAVPPDWSKMKPKELLTLLDTLPKESLLAVRKGAIAAGLTIPSGQGEFRELANGSVRVTVEIPNDVVPALKEWANAAGESLETFLKHFVNETITAYTMMDWQNAAAK